VVIRSWAGHALSVSATSTPAVVEALVNLVASFTEATTRRRAIFFNRVIGLAISATADTLLITTFGTIPTTFKAGVTALTLDKTKTVIGATEATIGTKRRTILVERATDTVRTKASIIGLREVQHHTGSIAFTTMIRYCQAFAFHV